MVDGQPVEPLLVATERATTDGAIDFMRRHAEEPFFLNIWYHTPHLPWIPPAEWASRYPDTPEGRYAAVVSHADHQIGRLVGALGDLGLAEHTFLFVTSDNGGTRKKLDSNGALRGHKGELYEGGIRVPLIARRPGVVPAASEHAGVFAAVDLLPTLADLAGVDISDLTLPGLSMQAALRGDPASDAGRALVWEGQQSVRSGDVPAEEWNLYAVTKGRWKLVHDATTGKPHLFDLEADLGETRDVAAENPVVATELAGEYARWRMEVGVFEPGVARLEGEVSVAGENVELGGGAVVLEPHSGFRVADGDFTFRTRITPAETAGRRTLLERPGSFWLGMEDGRVRLELVSDEGERTVLEARRRLEERQPVDLAFTLFGWRAGPSQARLYLDGDLEASGSLSSLRVSRHPIWLGNAPDGRTPFIGEMLRPSYRRNALLPAELAPAS